ncbi:MAG: hemerythrin domain-containing protein [Actinomycetota bacterium]|nr:hemerythrin domain-containing protein [Actinomycetota bacterium]
MNKNPIVDLVDEHKGIVTMLNIMQKITSKIQKRENIEKDHINKIVEFLSNFADKCHHGKEEDILFPELTRNSANIPLINELLGEHKSGRDYIGGMKASLHDFSTGSPGAYHIAINMQGYITLLVSHIQKETKELFPIADKEISENTKNLIEEKFEELESNIIGEGKHEEYHGWLKMLMSIYLGKN